MMRIIYSQIEPISQTVFTIIGAISFTQNIKYQHTSKKLIPKFVWV